MPRRAATPKGEALPPPLVFCWTLQQIATAHQLSLDAVRSAIHRGELHAFTLGKAYRVADTDYRRWLEQARRLSFSSKPTAAA